MTHIPNPEARLTELVRTDRRVTSAYDALDLAMRGFAPVGQIEKAKARLASAIGAKRGGDELAEVASTDLARLQTAGKPPSAVERLHDIASVGGSLADSLQALDAALASRNNLRITQARGELVEHLRSIDMPDVEATVRAYVDGQSRQGARGA